MSQSHQTGEEGARDLKIDIVIGLDRQTGIEGPIVTHRGDVTGDLDREMDGGGLGQGNEEDIDLGQENADVDLGQDQSTNPGKVRKRNANYYGLIRKMKSQV
eukprot:m.23587 g.23587  ORF g.23587 m.23587 type:complete len:102 (+) comp28503_c0_seq5:288-593(+)